MLRIITQTPQKSLSAEMLRLAPPEIDFNRFREALNKLRLNIDEADRENRQEIYVRDFLLEAFYRDRNEINKKGDIDLAVHLGKSKDAKVGVIIETKSPGNKSEMISRANLNAKALQQAVLYFMRERADEPNIDLRHIVVTNIKEWFVFKATDFNRLFYEDARFRREYEQWRDKLKVGQKTKDFYNDIAKPFLESLDEAIECTHFDLPKIDLADEKGLIALWKILSPFHLLKEPFADDSNALDRKFYAELLHIIGLEEVREKNKFLIRRKANRDAGSLIENAITILETKDVLHRVKNIENYGTAREERFYNVALELCITWINRILFLKLLEAQLVNYHEADANFRFLNTDTIADFDELFTLFHQVLAKTSAGRSARDREKFSRVPYLNSSLFEISELEDQTVTIESLKDNIELRLLNSSVLRKETRVRLPTLEYLFRFLDAYDFASEGKQEIRRENRPLVNASVLGKVFEKINGYKDGSIYTPGFITMYMCRQAIRLAVVQKFRDETDFDSDNFDDLRNYVRRFYKKEDIRRFNELVNSIKLCDPAVGSGHFLVSALNEILAIKSELGIFADAAHNLFDNYKIIVAGDELVITDRENNPFEYRIRNGKPLNGEMQNLQRALFHEKQMLIENCLFGVDINANSVKICRLRLWIELLKNAYYKDAESVSSDCALTDARASAYQPFTELETLPNIDINIKQGNSLLSRFALDADLREALKTIKYSVKDYRDKVNQYKNERNRETKREIVEIIERIKADFRTEIYKSHPKMRELLKFQRRFDELNSRHLFEKYNEFEREIALQKARKDIDKISAEIETIKSNRIYRNAFEWRFEFPEVLDNDGNFLGFDIVIGNPPYIRQEEIGELKDYLKKDYRVFTGTADILVYFYELGLRVLKQNGKFSFITSNKFMRANYGKSLRNFLGNFTLDEIIDFGDAPVFGGIAAYASIVNLQKFATENEHQTRVYSFPASGDVPDFETSYKTDSFNVAQKELTPNGWRLERTDVLDLLAKLRSKGKPLGEYVNGRFYYGIKTGLNEAFVVNRETRDRLIVKDAKSAEVLKPYLRGRDVKRWRVSSEDLWLIFVPWHFPLHLDTTIKGASKLAEKLFLENYPAIYNHLSKFKDKLSERNVAETGVRYEWYALQRYASDYWQEFEQPKIILPAIEKRTAFALDEEGYFGNDKTNICVSPDAHFLVAILNSSVTWWIIQQTASGKQGGYYEFKPMYVSQIPIPEISPEAQAPFVKLVDEILALKKQGKDTTFQENKIDEMVFELYELTPAEIGIVKGNAEARTK